MTDTNVTACECSEDYGPCEAHSETLVQREGASTRTADDLAVTFLEDLCDTFETDATPPADRILSPYGRTVMDEARADLEANRRHGVAWHSDDSDHAEAVQDVIRQAEVNLPDGVRVDWEDGYRITRVTGGPLLTDDAHPADCRFCAAGEPMVHQYEPPQS